MTAAIAFVRAHWRLFALAAYGAAAAGGGYLAHRPAPAAVHTVDNSHYEDDLAELVQAHSSVAPIADGSGVAERVTVRKYAPVICPAMSPEPGFTRPAGDVPRGALVEEDVTERGAIASDTTISRVEHQEQDRKLELTVTPSAAPGWAVAAGVEDPFGAKRLHLEVGRQLTDHFGVRVGWTPADGLVAGITPMLEFRF